MPLKLLIISLLLSLSAPAVLSSLETYEREAVVQKTMAEAQRIKAAAMDCFLGGQGNVRSVEIDLPAGAWIEVGGESNVSFLSIRCFFRGELAGSVYLSDPPVRIMSNGEPVEGKQRLVLACVESDGRLVVEVRS